MPFHALFHILFHHRKLFKAANCNVDIIIINLLKSCIKLGEYWWMCGGWATVSVCHGAASCQVPATTHLSPTATTTARLGPRPQSSGQHPPHSLESGM